MVVDQVLPDRHRIAADVASAASIRSRCGSHALAVGRATGPAGAESVDTSAVKWRVLPAGVGGHLRGNCRFCLALRSGGPGRAPAGPPLAGSSLTVSRRTPVARRCAQRPPSRPSARTCCCLCLLQDVAHPGEGHQVRRPRQRLGRRQLIAGFEVSINCRFWVSTEAYDGSLLRRLRRCPHTEPGQP